MRACLSTHLYGEPYLSSARGMRHQTNVCQSYRAPTHTPLHSNRYLARTRRRWSLHLTLVPQRRSSPRSADRLSAHPHCRARISQRRNQTK